ncbi:VOC family protein [Nocardia sp. NPDC049220]|uniref:VOC family protein n=1 Tax=Nocardia sp. NPDC049220 TaxID=3155273 RepID=UPI003410091D
MSTRLACVVFDADRPRSVAGFWAELLGWTVTLDRPDQVDVAAPDPDSPELALTFLPSTRAKRGKNRLHLDLASRSLDHQRTQVDQALALGAHPVDIGQGVVPWVVLADPEGNEFCVLEPRAEYVDAGAVAAIVVDTRDHVRLADFWSAASGWPVTRHAARLTGLRSATGLGSWLEFVHSAQPSPGRCRLSLDLAAFPAVDQAAELDRLRAAGATPIDSDRVNCLALTDPETNEFRLRWLAHDWSTT